MQNFIYKFTVAVAVVLPVVLIGRAFYLNIKKKPYQFVREATLAVFCAYFTALLILVLEPREIPQGVSSILQNGIARIQTGRDINLIPFDTIQQFSKKGFSGSFMVNIVANVFMFSPIGFFLPTLWKAWQKAIKTIGAGMLFSISIETIQLFIGRTTDIDDVILNTLGVAVGYILYKCLAKPLQKLSA